MRSSVCVFIAFSMLIGSAGAQSPADQTQQTPQPGFDAADAIFDVSAGTILRAGAARDTVPVYSIGHRVTARGRGICTEEACPLTVNNRDVFAERERLAVLRQADTDPATVVLADDQDYPTGWLRLRLGDRGETVKELQTLLVKDGAALTPDGVFGPATEAAIRDLQRRWRLDVDGAASLRTLYVLGVIGARTTDRTASF
jgi:hypothetical protein